MRETEDGCLQDLGHYQDLATSPILSLDESTALSTVLFDVKRISAEKKSLRSRLDALMEEQASINRQLKDIESIVQGMEHTAIHLIFGKKEPNTIKAVESAPPFDDWRNGTFFSYMEPVYSTMGIYAIRGIKYFQCVRCGVRDGTNNRLHNHSFISVDGTSDTDFLLAHQRVDAEFREWKRRWDDQFTPKGNSVVKCNACLAEIYICNSFAHYCPKLEVV